ncbi:hypothetical protein D3C80_1846460 [compost metagenome]
MSGHQHQDLAREFFQRMDRLGSRLPDKHPARTAKGMTEIEKAPAFVGSGQRGTHVRPTALQRPQQMLGGKGLLMNKLQPRHP